MGCGSTLESIALPAAAIGGSLLLGPEIGAGLTDLGIGGAVDAGTGLAAGTATAGGALAGAGLGAGASALTGGNPLTGALVGGVGGGIGPNVGDIISGLTGSGTPTPSVGGTPNIPGTAPATGTTAGGGIGAPSGGAPAAAAPASVVPVTGDVNLDQYPSSASVNNPFGSGSGGSSVSSSLPSSLPSGSPSSVQLPSGAGNISGGSNFNPVSGGGTPPTAATAGTTGNFNPESGQIGGATTAPNSISQLFSSGGGGGFTASNIGNALTKNANVLFPAAGLGYQAIIGNQEPKGYNELENTASTLANQGGQLQQYLQSGTLPPGLQASLDQAQQSAAASIRSQYAARGMSGSSAEAQDLQNLQQTIASQGASMALNLLNTGVSETQLSSQLYSAIMQQNMTQNQELSGAIANFATAAAGGTPGGTFKIVGA